MCNSAVKPPQISGSASVKTLSGRTTWLKGRQSAPSAALEPPALTGGQRCSGSSSEAAILLERGEGRRGGKMELLPSGVWSWLFTALEVSRYKHTWETALRKISGISLVSDVSFKRSFVLKGSWLV